MHVNHEALKRLLIALACSIVLLSLAWPFSDWQWTGRNGLLSYNLWWIGVVTLVAAITTCYVMWRKKQNILPAQIFWLVIPFIVSLFLVWKTGNALRNAIWVRGNTDFLTLYAYYSGAFIVDILLWIVIFPYEEAWGPHAEKPRIVWKICLTALALGISALTITHSLGIVHNIASGNEGSGIHLLQLWVQKITALIFIFLVARMLAPGTLLLARASFQSTFRNWSLTADGRRCEVFLVEGRRL